MSYTNAPGAIHGVGQGVGQGGPASTDSASPGELVRGSRHYRGAREAPRDFGLMSGNVTGAHVLLITAQQIRDALLKRQPRKYEPSVYVPTNIEAMAEVVNLTHQALMEVLAEVSEFISNSK